MLLNERTSSQRTTDCMTPTMWYSGQRKIMELENYELKQEDTTTKPIRMAKILNTGIN